MMNYQGHEQLRDDLAALSNTMSDLRLHIRALEVKYHDGCPELVYALAANGSQTGEGNNQRARSAGPRKTSKPRPRQLNG